MDCRDCVRYDPEAGRCRDGKVNPQHFETAFSVAKFVGIRAICVFNDHRERIIQGRRVPGQAAKPKDSASNTG